MGDVADDIVDGFLCEECGAVVDGDCSGYPRKCTDCRASAATENRRRKKGYRPRKSGRNRKGGRDG